MNIIALTRRSITLYLRDKQAVFFSFLSTIILIALYFLFIAGMYVSNFEVAAPGMFTKEAQYFIIYMQMMAGVVVLNSVSLALGVFGTVAKDFENRRTDSFMLTKAKPLQLQISYFAAAYIVSLVMNLLTWLVSLALIYAVTGYVISGAAILVSISVLAICSLLSCALMLFVTALIKSSTAIGVINGIAGTFLGFLCGIYMPYESLGKTAEIVGSALPFTHLVIWMKQTVLESAFAQVSIPPDLTDMMLEKFFSAKSVGFLSFDVSLPVMICYAAVFAGACLVAAVVLQKKRLTK
ncbi:ABC transporter permease [Clostridia bacterium]|nr:ABC transporter permease [Clostridia bacterium]